MNVKKQKWLIPSTVIAVVFIIVFVSLLVSPCLKTKNGEIILSVLFGLTLCVFMFPLCGWLFYLSKRLQAKTKTKSLLRSAILSSVLFVICLFVFIISYSFENDVLSFFSYFLTVVFLIILWPYWLMYFRNTKHERQHERWLQEEKKKQELIQRRIDSAEFQTYLQRYEHLSRVAAKLVIAKENYYQFSKFGGLPLVPAKFKWPSSNKQTMQFVAQFNFAEINPNGQIKDFPTKGLLYLFIDDIYTSNPVSVCKALFIETQGKLKPAIKPDDLEIVYKENNLTSELLKTYPDIGDSFEAKLLYESNTQYEMDELYSQSFISQNMNKSLVGGWGSYIQQAWIIPNQKVPEDWVLLCQIASDDAYWDQNSFMWGDCGTLYFYIRKEDLLACNFNNVKLELQDY